MSGSTHGLDELDDVGNALNGEEVLETETSTALGSVDNSAIHCGRKARFLEENGDGLGLDGLTLCLGECSER